MQTITEELLLKLKNASDIEAFFKAERKNFINITQSEYLNQMLEKYNLKISDVAKNSGAGEYVYKVFRGDRTASRDVLIAICFGMGLTLEETQLLLKISKFSHLYSRNQRDSIIIYALTHKMSVFELDDMLDKKNLDTIN
ncbi:MAG: hypothetical protein IKJ68_05390 [Clostridia bacterium]|nr:hypothetical protein [Clostridia bacterium]